MIDITPGQGSAISGLFTMLGAVVGILLANHFFAGRVKTLREALDEAHSMLTDHAAKTTQTLASISERLLILDTQSSSLASGVARIESNTADISDHALGDGPQGEAENWNALRLDWFAIRDDLERRASNDQIDGRTRAAYGRVDRRRYGELIEKMRNGGNLSSADAKKFDEALAIWQRYKNGRARVTPIDAGRLKKLRADLGLA